MSVPVPNPIDLVNRRTFLASGSVGLGSLALAGLLGDDAQLRASESSRSALPRIPHFAPKAKNVIYLFMSGGPSQMDLFDPKPKLNRLDGKTVDADFLGDARYPNIQPKKKLPRLLGSPYKFQQHGQSGATLSELLPHLSTVVDDIAFIKSMHSDTNVIDHPMAQLLLTTGTTKDGHPCLGSWLSYGLGSENENLPAFVVLLSSVLPRGGPGPLGTGFLPTVHQGVPFRSQGDPVLFLSNPPGVSAASRKDSIATINALNGLRRKEIGDPEIGTRIASFELAFRMQTSAPELVDTSSEPKHIQELYGIEPGKPSFANNCLLARRLVEQGVRIVQLVDLDWDHHGDTKERDLVHALPQQCQSVDQAIAGLICDLKQRGLLDETLVVWAAEFGRSPMNEERNNSPLLGRDHHPLAATFWMAGGGVKPGITYGATDDLAFRVVDKPVHIHDLNATILHLLGVDHERLTYRFEGREHRLTDVFGHVVHDIIA